MGKNTSKWECAALHNGEKKLLKVLEENFAHE